MLFSAILEHSPQAGLLEAELPLYLPKCVLNFGAEMSFGSFHQIIHPTSVTARKNDAPAAIQAAMTNLVGLGWASGGGGLIQTTSG